MSGICGSWRVGCIEPVLLLGVAVWRSVALDVTVATAAVAALPPAGPRSRAYHTPAVAGRTTVCLRVGRQFHHCASPPALSPAAGLRLESSFAIAQPPPSRTLAAASSRVRGRTRGRARAEDRDANSSIQNVARQGPDG